MGEGSNSVASGRLSDVVQTWDSPRVAQGAIVAKAEYSSQGHFRVGSPIKAPRTFFMRATSRLRLPENWEGPFIVQETRSAQPGAQTCEPAIYYRPPVSGQSVWIERPEVGVPRALSLPTGKYPGNFFEAGDDHFRQPQGGGQPEGDRDPYPSRNLSVGGTVQ